MQTFMESTRGLSLLFGLQWDRVMTVAAVGGALAAGAWLCALYLA